MVICALSLLAAGYTCVAADREIESAFLGGSSGFALFGWMAALSAAVILFTIGLARSLTGVLLKCERFRCRGANPFLLRQLGARLGLNAVMVGLLSFLIGFSIIGANFSLVQKVGERAVLNRDYPFDIIAPVDPADRQAHYIATAFNLADAPFDAEGLRAALTYRYSATNGLYAYERCDARIREYGRLQRNGVTAIFVVSALYIASVFLLIAMAMLALQTQSGLDEDRLRYAVLYCLGAGEREMGRALFWQTFCFFFLPFLLPVLLSIPTGVICGRIMTPGGSPGLAGEVYFNAVAIALILSAIYALYFTATYLIARRSVIRPHG